MALSEDVKAEIRRVNATKHPEGSLRSAPMGELMAIEALAGRYLYLSDARRWMKWSGKVWEDIGNGDAALRDVHEWVVAYVRDMVAAKADPRAVARASAYRDVGSLRALLDGAKTYPPMMVRIGDMDPDPYLLNVQNGIVDLRTGELMPHDPTRNMTRIAGAAYHPEATHPDLITALSALPCWEDRAYLASRLGQGATGLSSPDDVALFLQGVGANGKTVIMDSSVKALGTYAAPVMDSVLMGTESHPTERMDLKGLRLAVLEELPESRYLNAVSLKKVVGTGEIKARPIGGDPVAFRASHTLVMTSNYLPKVSETDHGTWRRLRMLKFPYRYVEHPDPTMPNDRQGDPELKHRMVHGKYQQEAVLAWIIDGAVKSLAFGMMPDTDNVKAATAEWRAAADAMGQFIAEFLVVDPKWSVMSDKVYEAYKAYVMEGGTRALSRQQFKTRLVEHPWLRGQVYDTRARPGVGTPVDGGLGPTPFAEAFTGRPQVLTHLRWRRDSDSDLSPGPDGPDGLAAPRETKGGADRLGDPVHPVQGPVSSTDHPSSGGAAEYTSPEAPPATPPTCARCGDPLPPAMAAYPPADRLHSACARAAARATSNDPDNQGELPA